MGFLEVSKVSKTYDKSAEPCVRDLDLSVEKGEILVILGPSGCGKTTILKMIAGLEKCYNGTISIDGERMNEIKAEKRPVSMVFQKPLLFRNLTVKNNINFAPRVKMSMRKEEMDIRTAELIKLVELEGLEDRKPNQLSGGQEQRVSLARALMTDPKVLLLDEPFSALDAKLRITMRENLRKIFKSIGQTVVFVTHDQQEAVAIGDRIALMMDGRIVQCGIPEEFYHNPVSKRAALFFGWKNAIPGKYNTGKVECQLGTFDVSIDDDMREDVFLMIHPQAAICNDEGEFSGTVKEASYLGTMSNYVLDCNGIDLSVQISSRNMFLEGETIRFDLDDKMICPVPYETESEMKPPITKKKGLFGKPIKKPRNEGDYGQEE